MDQSRGGWDFFFLKSDTLGSLEGGTFICGARNQWYTRMEGIGRLVCVWFSPAGLCVDYNNIIGQEIEGAPNLYLV